MINKKNPTFIFPFPSLNQQQFNFHNRKCLVDRKKIRENFKLIRKEKKGIVIFGLIKCEVLWEMRAFPLQLIRLKINHNLTQILW